MLVLPYFRFDGPVGYLAKIRALTGDDQTKALCFLETGKALEKKQDYPGATEAYLRAFTLPALQNDTWYFLNNNLGFCLNQLGRHDEAETHCRAAIAIDPLRHNAYKNLGICLEVKGRLVEAALLFLDAARIAPSDSRALDHLGQLLARHGEVGRDHPEILEGAQACSMGAGRPDREKTM